jgi:hypothetical protein
VNLTSASVFFSAQEPNQWICYNFHDKVRARAYSLQTDQAGSCPKKWVLEGSNDGRSWVIVGNGANDRDGMIKQRYQLYCPSFFQMIHLRQTGLNFWGDHQLAIMALEIVGCLVYDRIPSFSPKPMRPEFLAQSFPDLTADQMILLVSDFSRLFISSSPALAMGLLRI